MDQSMSGMKPVVILSPRDHDAVLFDLDGVLTQTARIHAAAWKQLFDEFLERRAAATGGVFVPFDIKADYLTHVDGKPRADGVAAFLAARGIDLPRGSPDDGPEIESALTLASRKDRYFLERLDVDGVEPYPAAVELVRALRARGIATAVVSSSNNCAPVLEAAGLTSLFDARVDGHDITRLRLKGKPAPDGFLEAARRLGVQAGRAVVIEDAIVGVQAGRAGNFGCVIGVDRADHAQALRDAGADFVVGDLAQVHVAMEPVSAWSLIFDGFDPAKEGAREALCALGNGYFTTRGVDIGAAADDVHYPGTYLAGGYNRLRTEIEARIVENEDLVNFPNWLTLALRIDDQAWFDPRTARLLSYRQEFDLRRNMLLRSIGFEDAQGRRSTLTERRLVSMDDMHLGAVECRLSAENWTGQVTIRSGIDANVVNAGAKLYRKFNNRHLKRLASEVVGGDSVFTMVRTLQSNLALAQVARTQTFIDGAPIDSRRQEIREPGFFGQELVVALREGRTLVIEKVASLHSSRDQAIAGCAIAARKAIGRAPRFDALATNHVRAWAHLWRRFDLRIHAAEPEIERNTSMLLRLNMTHLLQAISPNSIGLDIGVPARGWTGEAYQGHVFWDELFIFPFFNYRAPEITRSLLMYRCRRLDEARAAAAAAGLKGAMFPWQSGSDGQEETQALNLNPHSHRWIPDNSWLQRHVGSAIAYNAWQYFQVTHDLEFLNAHGAELILEIARFWSSVALFNEARGRYEIHGVMGPDEFHEAYPDSAQPGLRNNAYTNIMAVWVLRRAREVLDILSELRRAELMSTLHISAEEISRWDDISHKMFVPFHDDGIISQFEGYETLLEFDWEKYRAKYGNIQRLDLILESEGDSPNRYKLSKQADVAMLFYLFSSEELRELFDRLGYSFKYETIPRNVSYYASRTSHGSTLCRVVYAWVLARSDRPRSLRFFEEALQSDVADIQQGTTAEGIHLGAMAGTVDLVQRVWTGIEVKGDVLRLNPELPPEIDRIDMRIRYRGHALDLHLQCDTLTVRGEASRAAPIALCVDNTHCEVVSGETRVFRLLNGTARSCDPESTNHEPKGS